MLWIPSNILAKNKNEKLTSHCNMRLKLMGDFIKTRNKPLTKGIMSIASVNWPYLKIKTVSIFSYFYTI